MDVFIGAFALPENLRLSPRERGSHTEFRTGRITKLGGYNERHTAPPPPKQALLEGTIDPFNEGDPISWTAANGINELRWNGPTCPSNNAGMVRRGSSDVVGSPHGNQPVHVIAAKHQVHPTHVNQWKKLVPSGSPWSSTSRPTPTLRRRELGSSYLHSVIGMPKIQLEWLKKTWPV